MPRRTRERSWPPGSSARCGMCRCAQLRWCTQAHGRVWAGGAQPASCPLLRARLTPEQPWVGRATSWHGPELSGDEHPTSHPIPSLLAQLLHPSHPTSHLAPIPQPWVPPARDPPWLSGTAFVQPLLFWAGCRTSPHRQPWQHPDRPAHPARSTLALAAGCPLLAPAPLCPAVGAQLPAAG